MNLSLWMKLLATATLSSVVLTGCFNDSDDDNNDDNTSPPAEDFVLKVLHINDHHSHLAEDGGSLEIDEIETDVTIGGFPRVVAKFDEIETAFDGNIIKLHAGDAITGTIFYTLFEGEADADMMNQVCFDAFALGNHEFDSSDEGLKVFLDFLADGECNTPALAANVVPQVGTPLAPTAVDDYIKPYLVKEYGEESVGVIGIDIANKTVNSSSPLETTQFLDETTTAQQYIDELTADGVNKVILLTHYQYENDKTLAAALSGVDVIVGGDSHSLLGSGFEALGLNPVGEYPTEVTDKDGNKVCIVQAWENATIVGELDVVFNPDGTVKSCGGTPHLLLGDKLERYDEMADDEIEITGEEYATAVATIEANPLLSIVAPDADAAAALTTYDEERKVLAKQVIGTATEDLCFERIPGQGRSNICDVSETAMNGSDITNIVAKAFLNQSLSADIALQNGGGVRDDVAAGDITVEIAYTILPFANTLVNLDMTGAEIVATLEDALDYALNPEGSTGAYPYAANLRYDVDTSQAKGSRFTNIEAKFRGDTEWHPIDLAATYTVVTNSFIAGGRDGYENLGVVGAEPGRLEDTFLDYAQAFVDYVKAENTISKLPIEEYSTKSYK